MAYLFNITKVFRPRRTIKSEDQNVLQSEIQTAMHRLGDAPADGRRGVSTPFTVGTATAPDQAVTKAQLDASPASAVIAADEAADAALSAIAASGSATASAGSATAASGSATLAGTEKGYATEWAVKAEDSPVSVAAGGDGSTTFSAKHWAAKAEGIVSVSFNSLTDTNFTTLADGQLAVYDSATSKWVNQSPAPSASTGQVFFFSGA
jgi:hypothetical protein